MGFESQLHKVFDLICGNDGIRQKNTELYCFWSFRDRNKTFYVQENHIQIYYNGLKK